MEPSHRWYVLSLYLEVSFRNEFTNKSHCIVPLPFSVAGVFLPSPCSGSGSSFGRLLEGLVEGCLRCSRFVSSDGDCPGDGIGV